MIPKAKSSPFIPPPDFPPKIPKPGPSMHEFSRVASVRLSEPSLVDREAVFYNPTIPALRQAAPFGRFSKINTPLSETPPSSTPPTVPSNRTPNSPPPSPFVSHLRT